jgi:TRAP-type mannitol/chloroaromatic compound transport system substrate-binding protein
VAGEFFAQNIAGWNAIPISLTFPITVFVVRSLKGGALGCSMSVAGDYVVIARDGLMDNVALPHEIGHTCSLWHSGSSNNLMYFMSPAGENVKWFQKNLLRSSRHVQYW